MNPFFQLGRTHNQLQISASATLKSKKIIDC